MRILLVLALAAVASACSATQTREAAANPKHIDGSSISNTVPATPESNASGQKLYERLCAGCHGEKGDGVSELSKQLQPGDVKPSDLTDDVWTLGGTDGDLFVAIRDGVVPGPMKGLNGRPGIGEKEMWHIVNYVRSLRGR
jgi:cytochrome c